MQTGAEQTGAEQRGTDQFARATGAGNVVVQIVGENNAVTVGGGHALRLVDYLGPAFAMARADPARAGRPGYTATGRRETAILAPFNRESLPLQGRVDVLARLRGWLGGPDPISVQALIGSGGRGKTRIAVELAAEMRAAGWIAGFARREELDIFRAAGCRTGWDAPTLVIIDGAAAMGGEIAAWLRALVHEGEGDRAPLRLLLLERLGGEDVAWWRALFGGAGPEDAAVQEMLAPDAPLHLGPLADPAERYAVFAAAYREARAAAPPARDPSLDDVLAATSLGGEPLFLAMFGLIAARQGMDAARALSTDRIALDLAGQELRRIGEIWEAHGLDVAKERPLHAHLAAVACLCEGLDEAAAHAVIARESAALRQAIPPDATEDARAALHAALPGEAGGIAAIRPDILAEAAMIAAWKMLPDGGVETVRRAAASGQRQRVSRSVVRACQDFLIRGERAPMAWLQALQLDAVDAQGLLDLLNAMPQDTVALRQVARDLTASVLEIGRGFPGGEGAVFLASVLNDLSGRLSAIGQHAPALQAIEEAVAIRRAQANDTAASRLGLARSLINLSTCLGEHRREVAGVQPISEAIAILRCLVVDSAAARPPLAMALNNAANRLWRLKRSMDARPMIEEAVTLYRDLARTRPEAFQGKLAGTLSNLARILSACGQQADALEAAEESCALFRNLAAAHPDAFLPGLAASSADLAQWRAARGRLFDGGKAAEAAVAIYRELASDQPQLFLPRLARSLGMQGAILGQIDPAQALESFRAGIEALRVPFMEGGGDHAPLMGNLCNNYRMACAGAAREPDAALLAPIEDRLGQIRREDGTNG